MAYWGGFARDHGLAVTHLVALRMAAASGGGTVAQLASLLQVTPSAASQIYVRLERAALVTQGVDPTDRRRRPYVPTEGGRALFRHAGQARDRWVTSALATADDAIRAELFAAAETILTFIERNAIHSPDKERPCAD